ncbi:hypothetical protein T439DRAFT_300045 [Meredithblackwellia eburnea MCA 4105]
MSPSRIAKPSTVVLWVHPRSTSTMFECALLQRQDEFRVLHEPMGDAWYFGNERIAPRYSKHVCERDHPQYSDSSFAKVWGHIVGEQPSGSPQRTFSKDMAQYLFPVKGSVTSVPSLPKERSDDNPTLLPREELLDPSVHHTFLIRTPQRAIPSYHRLCYPGSPTGFEYWDPEEAGYKEERKLFDYLRSQGVDPLIIDSDDLLKDPEGIMRMWCENSQIDFDPKMLSWDEGTRKHFEKWAGFHTAAENSTGVGKGLKEEHCTRHESPEAKEKPALPEEVLKAIEDNMADYNYLKRFCRKP